jgi:hypothetical protein
MVTFLHVSDIHFSSFDGPAEQHLDRRVRELMLEDIARMRAECGAMDAMLLVGDVANTGHPDEYDLAEDFLNQATHIIDAHESNVVCVPGNHDVNRRVHDGVHEAVRTRLRGVPAEEISDRLHKLLREPRGAEALFEPLAGYNAFALRYGCALGPEQLVWTPKSFVLGNRKVVIHGLTSAWICDAFDSDERDDRKVALGAFQCAQVAAEEGEVSIAMVHHPRNWLRDAGATQGWINRAHVSLTGHEHRAGIYPDAARRRVAIESGAVNPERTKSGWVPAYNVLQLELDEANGELVCTIRVRCWQSNDAEFGPDKRFDDPYEVRVRLERGPILDDEPVPDQETTVEPAAEPVVSEERALAFQIMTKGSPDARRRAAAALDLIAADEVGGLPLDRKIMQAAQEQGKLKMLMERINDD